MKRKVALSIITLIMFPFFILMSDSANATLCNDGTISTSTGQGTCSWHGGEFGNNSGNSTVGAYLNSKTIFETCSKWKGSNESIFEAGLKFPYHFYHAIFTPNSNTGNLICRHDARAHDSNPKAEFWVSLFLWFFIWFLGIICKESFEEKRTPPNK